MKELSFQQLEELEGGNLLCSIGVGIVGGLICGFFCGVAADFLFCSGVAY